MFAAMELPAEVQLAAFNLACCRRIRHLITDDITLQALEALEEAADHATIAADLALAANQVGASSVYFNPASPLYDPSRNSSATRAVGHAVCRSLPPGGEARGPCDEAPGVAETIPEVIEARTPADYFEVMTRAVFQAGVSWKQITLRTTTSGWHTP